MQAQAPPRTEMRALGNRASVERGEKKRVFRTLLRASLFSQPLFSACNTLDVKILRIRNPEKGERACACASACVHVHLHVRVRVRVHVCVHAL